MTIEIDLSLMKLLNLTLKEYIYVYLLAFRKNKELTNLANRDELSKDEIKYLIDKKILTEDSDNTDLKLSRGIRSKFTASADLFEELYSIYPSSVVRPDGMKDFLRGDVAKCREAYIKLVGKDTERHNMIIKCLKLDIERRTKTGNMQYMKRLRSWISQEEWRGLEELLEENRPQINATAGYGTDIE